MNLQPRIIATKTKRAEWLAAVRAAFDCGHIGHGEMLLAFHEIDKWYSAELHAIDVIYEKGE